MGDRPVPAVVPGPPIDAPTAHLAVLGSPIAHSRSPEIHTAAYRELGLAWSYGRAELVEAELEPFLREHLSGEWRGFSLTMPLKTEAFRLASLHDPVASESGVVNTLLRLDSERQPWAGFNTDVGGLAAAIVRAGLDVRRTVILGAGATAVSALLAARDLGADRITIAARRPEAAAALVERFAHLRQGGVQLSAVGLAANDLGGAEAEATLVISTLPGEAAGALQLPLGCFTVPMFDVAYDPWPSSLATVWESQGGAAHSGGDMLVEQARLQLRIFVAGDPGLPIPGEERAVEAMRRHAPGVRG